MNDIQRNYGAAAQQYIELFGSVAAMHSDDCSLIERYLGSRSGAVLDVGCGPGQLTAHLSALGVQISGIDLVPEFIEHARATHPACRFDLGSAEQLEHADGSLDGVLTWYSLIHFAPDHLDAVLDELRRVLAVDGILVVGFFDDSAPDDSAPADSTAPTGSEAADSATAFDHQVVTAYRWPIDVVAARLERAGFDEVERLQRPGTHVAGNRPHAALVMRAR